jgi:hypothetical protein
MPSLFKKITTNYKRSCGSIHMKLTKSKLKRIIKEELQAVLSEQSLKKWATERKGYLAPIVEPAAEYARCLALGKLPAECKKGKQIVDEPVPVAPNPPSQTADVVHVGKMSRNPPALQSTYSTDELKKIYADIEKQCDKKPGREDKGRWDRCVKRKVRHWERKHGSAGDLKNAFWSD